MAKEIYFRVVTNFIMKEKSIKIGEKERHMERCTYSCWLQLLLLISRGCTLILHPSKKGTIIKAFINKMSLKESHADESLDLTQLGEMIPLLSAFSCFSKKILSTYKYILPSTP